MQYDTVKNIIKFFLPSVIVIAGFWINHRTALSRDKRKEQRTLLDTIVRDINTLREVSIAYHCNNAWNDAKAEEIYIRFLRLSSMIQRSIMYRKEQKSCKAENVIYLGFVRFKQSATLFNFSAEGFAQQKPNSDKTLEISRAALSLEDILEKHFVKIYP